MQAIQGFLQGVVYRNDDFDARFTGERRIARHAFKLDGFAPVFNQFNAFILRLKIRIFQTQDSGETLIFGLFLNHTDHRDIRQHAVCGKTQIQPQVRGDAAAA